MASRSYSGQTNISFPFRALLWVQGMYYLVTGIWPLASIDTFQMVTGPKTDHLMTGRQADHWLVMTVGVLVTAIAMALLITVARRVYSPTAAVLAIASAAGLTGIDIFYVLRQVIDPIYLVDAAIQIVLLAGWVFALCLDRQVAARVQRDFDASKEKS